MQKAKPFLLNGSTISLISFLFFPFPLSPLLQSDLGERVFKEGLDIFEARVENLDSGFWGGRHAGEDQDVGVVDGVGIESFIEGEASGDEDVEELVGDDVYVDFGIVGGEATSVGGVC